MPGKKKKIGMIAIIQMASLVFPAALSQDRENLMDQAEEILSRDETSRIPDEIYEESRELILNPVNINTATPEELEASGLFTSFQIRMIIEYRELYGELYSIYEMASITGFRLSRLKEIEPYITVTNSTRAIRRHTTGTRVLFFAGRTFPAAAGYKSREPGVEGPIYTGSPLKTSLRMDAPLGRHTRFGLAYGKDPGEKGFNGFRPEYLTGYIQTRGHRILDQVVLGSFRLQHGLGLIQGATLFNAPSSLHSRPVLLSSLKPYAGLNQSGLHRGLACRLNIHPVKVTFWSSLQSMDLSVDHPVQSQGAIDWVSYQRHSGLHRTSLERSWQGLGYLANAGIQVMVSHRNFMAGIQFSSEISGLTNKGKDSLRITSDPALFNSIGIHWRWHMNRFETYGEYSAGNLGSSDLPGSSDLTESSDVTGTSGLMGSSAILVGFRYHFNDFLAGSLLLHGYGAAHRETFSSAYASGSHINNEKGLMLHLRAEPGRNLLAELSVELFGYPSPRTFTRVPSMGYRYCCTLQSAGHALLQWRVRFVKKIWQQTPASPRQGIRPLAQNQLSRVDGRLDLQPAGMFHWQSRLVATFVSGNQPVPGYAALQQARMNLHDRLKCTIQFVVFNIPHWDNRIYLYEPGLYHHFNFPVYSGRGQKLTAVISLKPCKRVILEGKVSGITYHDRDQLGSGHDMVEGSGKIGAGLQVRLNL